MATTELQQHQGLEYGEHAIPWEKMSQKECNKAVIGKAKSNISAENTVMMGNLEVQSRWFN